MTPDPNSLPNAVTHGLFILFLIGLAGCMSSVLANARVMPKWKQSKFTGGIGRSRLGIEINDGSRPNGELISRGLGHATAGVTTGTTRNSIHSSQSVWRMQVGKNVRKVK